MIGRSQRFLGGEWQARAQGMPNKYNPFRPDKICPPGIFCGRMDELRAIDQCLLQTKNGNPQHFLVEGERGIGKSSILLVGSLVASGSLKTLDLDKKLDFILVSISLTDKDDHYSIIKKIAGELRKQLASRNALKTLALGAWEFISKIEGAGFRYNREAAKLENEEVFTHLQADLVKVASNLGDIDGVLILIDEADKPSAESGLGVICKLLTEEMTKRGCDRLCIGLAGLPTVLDRLKESHESSLRIFKTMEVAPLEEIEIGQVIDRGLKEAVEKNGFEITITPEAKRLISSLSEGYPHFLQEFAFCAFEEDLDNVIDRSDVTNSLFRENGAFDQLGRKFFNQYYSTPDSDDYRTVLNTMADHSANWVTRAQIIKESGLKGSTVDNALRALKAKNVIIQHDMKTGHYRLPTRSFAVWIKARQAATKTAAAEANNPNLFESHKK